MYKVTELTASPHKGYEVKVHLSYPSKMINVVINMESINIDLWVSQTEVDNHLDLLSEVKVAIDSNLETIHRQEGDKLIHKSYRNGRYHMFFTHDRVEYIEFDYDPQEYSREPKMCDTIDEACQMLIHANQLLNQEDERSTVSTGA